MKWNDAIVGPQSHGNLAEYEIVIKSPGGAYHDVTNVRVEPSTRRIVLDIGGAWLARDAETGRGPSIEKWMRLNWCHYEPDGTQAKVCCERAMESIDSCPVYCPCHAAYAPISSHHLI